MFWSKRKVEPVPKPPPLSAEQRLTLVNAEYRAAEARYNQACQELQKYLSQHRDRISMLNDRVFVAVNAMATQPVERKLLEKIRMEKLSRRNELLAQRAEVLQGVRHETT